MKIFTTLKPVFSGHSKRPKIGFQDQLSLKVLQNAPRVFCNTLSSLSYCLSLRPFFSFFEWPLTTGFTVHFSTKSPFSISAMAHEIMVFIIHFLKNPFYSYTPTIFKTHYGKYSKISNTSWLQKSGQTAQTQTRLLLIRVFPVCYSDEHFVIFQHT